MNPRTHLSKEKVDSIILKPVEDEVIGRDGFKPKGFWWEVDNDWQRWCLGESFRMGNWHLYEVDLGTSNILEIKTLQELDDFHMKYRCKLVDRLDTIDWKRVTGDYDGVEIAPYQWKRRLHMDYMWYYGWDCASGVVWRPRGGVATYIKEVTLKENKEN